MDLKDMLTLKPIGFMKSVFHFKNGTPRQSSLCENARGVLTIEKSIFNNPEHSLEGLQEFSHAWVLFMFHKNNNAHKKAKVKPPRLDGQRVGVFSTRSPYRPNNIGLSLVKIDKIQDATIHFSGIDILDGTPVIDIKPYIPDYDKPSVRSILPSEDASPFVLASNSSLRKSEQNVKKSLTKIIENPPVLCSIESFNDLNHSNFNESGAALSCSYVNSTSSDTYCDSGTSKVDNEMERKKCDIQRTVNSVGFSNTNKEPETIPSVVQTCSDIPHDSVEEGFYSLSAALDKAGDALQLGFEHRDPDLDIHEHSSRTLFSASTKSDHDIPSFEIKKIDSNLKENDIDDDEVLDFLVDDVICKAASDVLSNNAENGTINPSNTKKGEETIDSSTFGNNSAVTAPWLTRPPVSPVDVIFSAESLHQLQAFHPDATDDRFRTEMLSGPEDAKRAITSILHEEPRSVYRRQKCQNSVYFFALDVLHVTCWFDGDVVTVLRVKPSVDVPELKGKGRNV